MIANTQNWCSLQNQPKKLLPVTIFENNLHLYTSIVSGVIILKLFYEKMELQATAHPAVSQNA